MDAHVFRLIAHILGTHLFKARLERIHAPVPNVTALSFFAHGQKQCLLLHAHRSAPLLFLTKRSPLPNPAFPPANIMRLRKYAEGRILGEVRINWPARQMAFALPGPDITTNNWLLLDCKYGCSIVHSLPENFNTPPLWPQPSDVPACIGEDATSWQLFQVLTPTLRRTLMELDPADAAALMVDLESGSGDLFWYGEEAPPSALSAWPLPATLRTTRNDVLWEKVTPPEAESVLPLLEAMQLPLLLATAKAAAETPAQKTAKAVTKKKKRLLDNLEQEKRRLESMLALGDDARLIQENLWRFSTEERRESVSLPLDQMEPDSEMRVVTLNPLISIGENMQIMFRKANKATRGMVMLERRMTLTKEASKVLPNAQATPASSPRKHGGKKPLFSPSLIQEFLSSDGFTLWRGRNAEGNRNVLKLANSFDFWFHVEDGPSAHLILRRDHAAQDVPEKTLMEAAILTGMKSWRKDDPKAPIMMALAKHVQPIKGAPAGTVRVQETVRTILALLDTDVEERLKQALQNPL